MEKGKMISRKEKEIWCQKHLTIQNYFEYNRVKFSSQNVCSGWVDMTPDSILSCLYNVHFACKNTYIVKVKEKIEMFCGNRN